jgi:hypothetical protein
VHKPGLHPPEVVPESGSFFKNFYRNVAARLDVDTEIVIRVALGQQRSRKIEAAMERELRRIARVTRSGGNGLDGRAVRIESTKRNFGLPKNYGIENTLGANNRSGPNGVILLEIPPTVYNYTTRAPLRMR